jgi:hypothetical protein
MTKGLLENIQGAALLEEMNSERMPKIVHPKGREPGFSEVSLELFF